MVVVGCSPTDELAYTIFTDDMKRRLGNNVKPPVVLLDRHVSWMHFETIYLSSVNDPVLWRSTYRAAATHLIAWLGWLRTGENFGLTWGNTSMMPTHLGPEIGLPLGMGAVELDLLLQTKSNQTDMADVGIAYETASGKSLGLWLGRFLWSICPRAARCPSASILCHESGLSWTSHYFCYTYPMFILFSLCSAHLATSFL
jgi:hypothetical protein